MVYIVTRCDLTFPHMERIKDLPQHMIANCHYMPVEILSHPGHDSLKCFSLVEGNWTSTSLEYYFYFKRSECKILIYLWGVFVKCTIIYTAG